MPARSAKQHGVLIELTVEVHLRQLRTCVLAGIDIFKMLNGIAAKGGGS